MAFSNREQLADRAELLISNRTDQSGIPRPTIITLVNVVVPWVSRYSPRTLVSTLSGDGTYQIALPASWVAGFSVLSAVEHPLDEQEPNWLDAGEYILYPSQGTATHIQFIARTPDTGTDNIKLIHTAPHAVDGTSSTVPDHEEPAYEFALACICCKVRATEYGQTTDSTLASDAVDYRSKSGEWLALARSFCESASLVLGVDISGTAPGGGLGANEPAGRWLEWDPPTAYGRDPIFRDRFGGR